MVWLERNAGKGTAVAAGIEALLASGTRPEAVVVVDADGQHPPERIPQLAAAAATADLVIGDRLGEVAAMPRVAPLDQPRLERAAQRGDRAAGA